MTVPAKLDITITRGDTEIIVYTVTSDGTTPINITGRTYASKIRYDYDAVASYAFTSVLTSPTTGVVTLTLAGGPSSVSASLTPGLAYWDLEETVTATGVVSTLVAGKCTILGDTTWP